MEPDEIDEARQSLEQLEQRIERDVNDIRSVLRADLPKHVQRTVRRAFERDPASDTMTDAQVAALKEATTAAGAAICEAALAPLSELEAWLWPAGEPLPEAPEGFDEHPRLAEALAEVPRGLEGLLAEHGLSSADAGHLRYRVPAYFVAGQFMKSLLADYWRALTDHAELARRLAEGSQAETREARRRRWEQA